MNIDTLEKKYDLKAGRKKYDLKADQYQPYSNFKSVWYLLICFGFLD